MDAPKSKVRNDRVRSTSCNFQVHLNHFPYETPVIDRPTSSIGFVGIIISAFIVLISAPDKIIVYLIVMIVLQQLDANVIAPKILGSSAGISSLGVIIAVTVMGAYFGIVGMILGVPFFAVVISIVRKWLEKKLSAKNLPVATKEYYTDRSYSHENEEQKSITRMIFDPFLKRISQNVNKTISETSIHEDDEDDYIQPFDSEQIDSKEDTKQ